MAKLATTQILPAGVVPALVAATGGGDTVDCSMGSFLMVNNASGSPITVTFVTPGNTGFGAAIPDLAVVVAAGTTRFIGPISDQYYKDPTDGLCHITYSGVTTLTVGAFSI